eukprot:scaffold2314_cov267-Pinguiococcus_pyrenoidosus.AAC.3
MAALRVRERSSADHCVTIAQALLKHHAVESGTWGLSGTATDALLRFGALRGGRFESRWRAAHHHGAVQASPGGGEADSVRDVRADEAARPSAAVAALGAAPQPPPGAPQLRGGGVQDAGEMRRGLPQREAPGPGPATPRGPGSCGRHRGRRDRPEQLALPRQPDSAAWHQLRPHAG